MSAPLEIRNSPSGKAFPAIGPFIVAAISGFFVLRGLSTGASGGGVFVLALVAAGCVGLGLFMAQGMFDNSVQVTLDAKGFRDRRAGDVLVSWDKVSSAELVHGNHGGPDQINLVLTEELPDAIKYSNANALALMLPFGKNTVHMEIASLDITGAQVMAAIRRLAPHVKVLR